MTISIPKKLLTACLLFAFAFTITGCDTIKEITAPAVEVVKEVADQELEITCRKPLAETYQALEYRLAFAASALFAQDITLTQYDITAVQIDDMRMDLMNFKVNKDCDTAPNVVHDRLDEIETTLEQIDKEIGYYERSGETD